MSSKILQHLSILGTQVKDKVTGFKGVAVSVSFDLYGCIQAVVSPEVGPDGKIPDSQWFDINRLEAIPRAKRAMPCPDFIEGRVAEGKQGAASKPPLPQMPKRRAV